MIGYIEKDNYLEPIIYRIASGDGLSKKKVMIKGRNITFDQFDKSDQIPYDLLLLADPSKNLIDEYFKLSDIFTARENDETIGIIVLFPLTTETV